MNFFRNPARCPDDVASAAGLCNRLVAIALKARHAYSGRKVITNNTGKRGTRSRFLVTNLARPAERVVAFYNQRDTAKQWINEPDPAVVPHLRSQLPSGFSCTRSPITSASSCARWRCPNAGEPWSLTTLREKLIKIGAKVVSDGRYVTFQLAEVTVSRQMFADILSLIVRLRAPFAPA